MNIVAGIVVPQATVASVLLTIANNMSAPNRQLRDNRFLMMVAAVTIMFLPILSGAAVHRLFFAFFVLAAVWLSAGVVAMRRMLAVR